MISATTFGLHIRYTITTFKDVLMNNQKIFSLKKYCLIENAISTEIANLCTQYTLFDEAQNFNKISRDGQVPKAYRKYSDALMESLLIKLLPMVEENTGLSLWPTCSYYRVYRSGDELFPHKDRESCEISCTLFLGARYPENFEGWPIFIENNGFLMEPGDMIIYRGAELTHSRNILSIGDDLREKYFHSQVFFHYVDKNGPYKDNKFDGRESIGIMRE